MSNFQLFIGLVVGSLIVIVGLAMLLPCEGCRLRRERIARGLAKLRAQQDATDK